MPRIYDRDPLVPVRASELRLLRAIERDQPKLARWVFQDTLSFIVGMIANRKRISRAKAVEVLTPRVFEILDRGETIGARRAARIVEGVTFWRCSNATAGRALAEIPEYVLDNRRRWLAKADRPGEPELVGLSELQAGDAVLDEIGKLDPHLYRKIMDLPEADRLGFLRNMHDDPETTKELLADMVKAGRPGTRASRKTRVAGQ